jgi:polyhydroxyalkanoate synthesis regulator phasin
MDSTLVFLLVGLLAVGAYIWRVKLIAAENRTWSADDALVEFRQAISLVEKFAPAVDQLVKIGELQPEQRRAAVIDMVKEILPNADVELIKWVIESWVSAEKKAEMRVNWNS